jgi:hypothetical protein
MSNGCYPAKQSQPWAFAPTVLPATTPATDPCSFCNRGDDRSEQV